MASKFPPLHEHLQAGNALLFEDARIMWGISEIEGGIEGKRVLEPDPLEGAYMLEKYGAASIVAVEANTRAYLKCLITKEILNLIDCPARWQPGAGQYSFYVWAVCSTGALPVDGNR